MYDVTIIGAGITGSFIAHNLSKYNMKVLVLEKELEVSNGVTKANSAIIHPGFDPEPGSLKAILNVKGNEMYPRICEELNVRYNQIGSFTIATNEEEAEVVDELVKRAEVNKVEVEVLNKEQLLEREPNLGENVIKGIYAKTTGIIAPWEMVYGLLENAIHNGVEVKTDTAVVNINKKSDFFEIETNRGTISSKYVINAAGLYAEQIYRHVCNEPEFKIIPTRGQYYLLDNDVKDVANHVIYPTPTKKGKGVLIVPTIDGNIMIGPTADTIDEFDNTDTTKEGFTYIRDKAKDLVKNIPYKSVIHSFSGIRPKTDGKDFIIGESKVSGFINVAGIESPGLASAPAIAEMVEEIVLKLNAYEVNSEYKVYKQKHVGISELSNDEVNKRIKENPKYGNIVCRCEKVSEGEIIDAINSLLPVKTIDGVKRRCRTGMGRCQGGFCQPLVVEILARELGIDKTEVLLDSNGSNLLIEETKSGSDINE